MDFQTFNFITLLANFSCIVSVIRDITFTKKHFPFRSQLKGQFSNNALKGIFKLCALLSYFRFLFENADQKGKLIKL